MVSVLIWIGAKEWGIKDGDIESGSEVTVYGERSFEKFDKNLFWGRLIFFVVMESVK